MHKKISSFWKLNLYDVQLFLLFFSCEELLQAYLKERQDDLPFVFLNAGGTGPINIHYVKNNFRKYRKELGIHLSPHTLSHTFAAHLALKGMPLVGIQAP
ncbi:tyrosine-type recombinase/integrase [Paenisporosarcina sp.]|uniref:tyrosine-type recombinase/integrase n=1 Tax=Paenisporosarcina sp. TaxID=1932001 RepID=UPI003C7790DB